MTAKQAEMLKTKIKSRGLKIEYVAKVLGLSRTGLWLRFKGKSYFDVRQVSRLIELLELNMGEVQEIFFNEDVEH